MEIKINKKGVVKQDLIEYLQNDKRFLLQKKDLDSIYDELMTILEFSYKIIK